MRILSGIKQKDIAALKDVTDTYEFIYEATCLVDNTLLVGLVRRGRQSEFDVIDLSKGKVIYNTTAEYISDLSHIKLSKYGSYKILKGLYTGCRRTNIILNEHNKMILETKQALTNILCLLNLSNKLVFICNKESDYGNGSNFMLIDTEINEVILKVTSIIKVLESRKGLIKFVSFYGIYILDTNTKKLTDKIGNDVIEQAYTEFKQYKLKEQLDKC